MTEEEQRLEQIDVEARAKIADVREAGKRRVELLIGTRNSDIAKQERQKEEVEAALREDARQQIQTIQNNLQDMLTQSRNGFELSRESILNQSRAAISFAEDEMRCEIAGISNEAAKKINEASGNATEETT